MNNLYLTAFVLIIATNSLLGQNSKALIDGKKIILLDTTYTFQDSTQKIFINTNSTSIWNLRQQITKLSFDHCNHNEVSMLLYADSTGDIPMIQLITGTHLLKIDSLIISIAKEYSKLFKPVNSNHSLIYIKYQFHDKEMEALLSRSQGNYTMSAIFTNPQLKSILNNGESTKATECENDFYFYKEGIKSFQVENYKMAIYNFSQALIANPFNMDANYNLGLAYQKAEKFKKACDCFSKGDALGDTSSITAMKKYCTELKSK